MKTTIEQEVRLEMKYLRLILSAGCLGLLLPLLATFGVSSARGGTEETTNTFRPDSLLQVTITPTISAEVPFVFEVSLAELGYEEQVLSSPYSSAKYTLRLPEGWKLREGSTFELDLTYAYHRLNFSETDALPAFFGDVLVIVDGETQLSFPITEPDLQDAHLSVELPPSLLNDPTRVSHTIEVVLDAGFLCYIPHQADLIIHSTSFFSLFYERTPIVADLALYPRPFYQDAFEPDRVQFVLPASPTQAEVSGAAVVAARLGNLTDNNLVISGTTDLALIDRLVAGELPQEHLIIIGSPERNEAIVTLDQLGVLPVSLGNRQANLASSGPAVVVPGRILTYTLTLTNTTPEPLSSLSLIDRLPDYTQMISCSSACTQEREGEVNWLIDSLEVGGTLNYTLELRLSDVITEAVAENTATLLDAAARPINVSTLTATVGSVLSADINSRSSVSPEGSYFFWQGGRAVAESDGIIQELVSPWDQTKAILVITGLGDQAVYKASQAMSFESHFPAMHGPLALVRAIHADPEYAPEEQAVRLTLADLGYEDSTSSGSFQSRSYWFNLPLAWELNQGAYFELHFSHSQLINYENSSLTVLFNSRPLVTIGLSEETSQGGILQVELPGSPLAHSGRSNRIEVQAEMQPRDKCGSADQLWTVIKSDSLLHLEHGKQNNRTLDLALYPIPFDRQPDLSDVRFVLPELPQPGEWELALQLSAALGSEVDGSKIIPAVTLGAALLDTDLSDYHLITIGRPTRNPILQQVNTQLPQPFLPDSDRIEQKLREVVLRLPPEVSLGYVQLLPSPWNENLGLLAVTGTSDEGVTWASQSLSQTSLSRQLSGNLAVIRDQDIQTLDTRQLTRHGLAAAVSAAVPELTTVAAVTPTIASSTLVTATVIPTVQSPEATAYTPPNWLVPLVTGTALAVIIIFAIAIWQALRRRKTSKSYDHL